jgi:GntR family transcriptional regulator, transcriptional repressor for pyruvate dehydrogenase complex
MTVPARASAKISVLLAEAIAEDIVSRGLRPGDRLATEAEMIAEYEVGRATLREALRVLEAQGVIEIRVGSGGGPFVARPGALRLARMLSLLLRMSDVTLREVLDARLIIEPALAGQAARHAGGDHVRAIQENQRTLERAARGNATFMRVNEEFHTLIADASGNRPLAALWSALATVVDGQEAGVRYTPAALTGMVAAHRKITDAITAQDATEATRSMSVHLEAQKSYVARYYPSIIDNPVSLVSGLGLAFSGVYFLGTGEP